MIGIEFLDFCFSDESKLETIQHIAEYKSFQLKSLPRAMDIDCLWWVCLYSVLPTIRENHGYLRDFSVKTLNVRGPSFGY